MRVQSGLGALSATTGGGSLVITTSSLPAATQGTPYSQTLAASGGSGTYVNWTVIGGSLPAFDAGPLPLPGIALSYTGIVYGMPALPGTGSVTIQVEDSAGNTAQATLPWMVNAAAPAVTWKYSQGGFNTYIDPTVTSEYVGPNAWNGGSSQSMRMWNTQCWATTVPIAYSSGNIQGYPYCGRGGYPAVANPCDPANGGSSSAPGVQSAIQISAITQAKLRKIINLPINRQVAQIDQLEDMYVVGTAVPAGGRTTGYATPGEIIASISVFTGFLDTSTYWETFIGTANSTAIAKATLTRATDYQGTGEGGLNSTAYWGCIELDGRMWFVALGNEDWAQTPSSGLCNTIRMFPSPWNELHQVGNGAFLTVDMGNLLRDLLASSMAAHLPFTSSDYLSGVFAGVEPDGLSSHYTMTGATQTNPLVITVSTTGTNPFAVGNRVGFYSVGGMTQLDIEIGTVSAIGGTSGAFTATFADIDASGFSAYTSGGTAHTAVLDFQVQTAMQSETPPAIYTVPEISQNISRQPTHVPVSASADAGGVYVAANAVTANYNLWWMSNAKPTTGSPVYFGMNFNGLSSTLKKYGLLTWSGVYLDQDGNSDYYLGLSGSNSDWLLGDYTIDGNPSTSGTYPTTGWTTLATVTGNSRRERAHFIGDWSAYNWLRINCTALGPTDSQSQVAFHVDVLNAPNTTGLPDGWGFTGDSIINKVMLPGDTEEGGASDFFGSMIYNYTGHIPIGHDMGSSGWTLCRNAHEGDYPPTEPWVDGTYGTWLADFPCRYIWYGLGYNDPAASVTEATYLTTLAAFLNIAIGLGKTTVVPGIWYSKSDSGATSTTWTAYNYSLVNLALSSASGSSVTMTLGSTANPLVVGQQVVGSNGGIATVSSLGGSTGAWTAGLSSSALAGSTTLSRPQVLQGPNLNAIGAEFILIMMNTHDTIHPSPYGQAMFRAFVTDWIARCIYLGQDPATWVVPYVLGTGTYGMGGIGGAG